MQRLGVACVLVAGLAWMAERAVSAGAGMMSPCAAVQYLCDMRHTTLGARWASRESPPLRSGALKGKLALITGGTGGIGLAAAKYLAAAGAEVHVTGRNEERGAAAAQSGRDLEGSIVYHKADLSGASAAKAFAAQFLSGPMQEGSRPLDLLVQNLAGMFDSHARNADGRELSLGTNLLSFYVTAKKLGPHIADGGRMVNVVSAGMHLYRVTTAELEQLDRGADFDGIKAYSMTHRVRVLLSELWATAPPWAPGRARVAVASVHPGWVETEGLRSAAPMAAWYSVMRPLLRSEAEGADTVAWLAGPSADLASAELNGGYFWDRSRRPVDLLLAGTQPQPGELDDLVAHLEKLIE